MTDGPGYMDIHGSHQIALLEGSRHTRRCSGLRQTANTQECPVTPVTGRPKNAVKDALPRLRVQVASDLHLEFIKRRFPGERVIKPLPNADLLVLAGDITNSLGILDAFGDWPVPILYLLGNHESYGRAYDEDRQVLPRGCRRKRIAKLKHRPAVTAV